LKYCWHIILNCTTCPPEEDILRAIVYPHHYDDVKKEIHSSLFTSKSATKKVSVNRKSVYTIIKHIEIFKRNHDKPDEKIYVAKIGQINIKEMNYMGRKWKDDNPEANY